MPLGGTHEAQTMSTLQGGRIVLVIFSLALFLRLLHFSQSVDNPLLYHPVLDEAYYIEMGGHIAGGMGWQDEGRAFFMDPLYGYLLGSIFSIFGEDLSVVRLFQILLDSLNVLLIYAIGIRMWSRSAGIAAAVIYAVYKIAFFYTLLILKTTAAVTLSLVFVLAVLKSRDSQRSLPWFLLGMLGAVMVYLRANFICLVPLTIVFHWVLDRPNGIIFLKRSTFFLMGFLLLISLGALRNYMVSGEVVWLNAQSGRLLYACNNPENVSGRYQVPSFSRPHPLHSENDFRREAERRVGRALSVKEASTYWRRETLRLLGQRPKILLVLFKNKLKGTIADHEIPVNHSYDVAAQFSGVTRWPLPTFALVFALGLPGLVIGGVKKREAVWLVMPVLCMLITVTVFYTSSRFRMPALPFLVIGAGIALATLADWVRRGAIAKSLGLLATAALLFTFSLSVSEPKMTGTEEFYLAKAYWSQKEFQKARIVATKAGQTFPQQARFPTLLGMIALSEDRFEEAIAHNQRALEIDRNHADAYHNLGIAYLLSGRPQAAVEAIEKAVAFGGDENHLFSLARAYDAVGDERRAEMTYKGYLQASSSTAPHRSLAEKRLAELLGAEQEPIPRLESAAE